MSGNKDGYCCKMPCIIGKQLFALSWGKAVSELWMEFTRSIVVPRGDLMVIESGQSLWFLNIFVKWFAEISLRWSPPSLSFPCDDKLMTATRVQPLFPSVAVSHSHDTYIISTSFINEYCISSFVPTRYMCSYPLLLCAPRRSG